MDIMTSGSDNVCEDSASIEFQDSFEEPASDHRTEAPALCYHDEPDQPAFEPLLATNTDNINSGFPPSFTEMLTNLSTEAEKDMEDLRHEGPTLCYHEEPDQPALEPLLATNIDTIISGFPPSFTEMLTNLSTENEAAAEDPHPLSGTDHHQEVYTQDTCHDVATNENTAGKQIDTSKSTNDIMSRIKTYLADDSFHDMLFKLGRVIDELGMDLSE